MLSKRNLTKVLTLIITFLEKQKLKDAIKE